MEELIEFLESNSKNNHERENDIPIAIKCFNDLEDVSKNLRKEMFPSKLWPAKAIQASVILGAMVELNGSIISSLKSGYYSSVECLFRVTIEHAVNVIYIFENNDIERSRSYLKHAIESLEDKSKKRDRRAVRENDSIDKFGADQRLSFASMLKTANPNLFKEKKLKWPNAFERFKAVGLEKGYRNLYSTASDSVHSMSEDVINSIVAYNCPGPAQEALLESNESYRKSFSIYLSLWALEYFAEALELVATSIESESLKEVEKARASLFECIIDHEVEAFELSANNALQRACR
ncbi:MAG: DUF5677 domain-containing protein [Cellvibrionaceae bacterium]|nr:DUF5677 domain-containing protein [Cellvibrionaceae bacterium]